MRKCLLKPISNVLASLLLMAFCSPTLADVEPPLKQKIAQMLMLGFKGTSLDRSSPIARDIFNQNIGGVVLFGKNPQTEVTLNISNPRQLKQLTKSLQAYTHKAAISQHNQLYPLLIAVDYEGGSANPLKPALGFPDTFSAAELAFVSKNQAIDATRQMAATLKNLGLNLDFAPVLDLNVNPHNPVISHFNRSFSANPKIVSFYANLYQQAFHQAGILCTYKHFPGHGSSSTDSHYMLTDITSSWQKSELAPYQQLFAQTNSCDFVMIGHLINRHLDGSGLPATLSKPIITDLLRQQLHFTGLVVTDDLQMKAITDRYTLEQTVRLAINAGADILLFANQQVKIPQDAPSLINMIYADVQSGKISEQRINEAYARIHKLKLKLSS